MMKDHFVNYRNWVKDSITDEKIGLDALYAINWMEYNALLIDPDIFTQNAHPCLAFSHAINFILENARDKIGSFQPIVDWLMENKRCPFGLRLKVKALRVMRRSIGLLSQSMIDQLNDLQDRSYKMEYRPREFLYLDKLLLDLGLTNGCTGASHRPS
jgi:hypothetical protein